MSDETRISVTKAAWLLGITTQTLRVWTRTGKVKCIRTLGGHRRYTVSEVMGVLSKMNGHPRHDLNVVTGEVVEGK